PRTRSPGPGTTRADARPRRTAYPSVALRSRCVCVGRDPGMKRPPTHPAEHACPCCLPALGEFSEMPPHGGLPASVGEPGPRRRTRGWVGVAEETGIQTGPGSLGLVRSVCQLAGAAGPCERFRRVVGAWVPSSAEDSPRGLWRSLGKRVGLTALAG